MENMDVVKEWVSQGVLGMRSYIVSLADPNPEWPFTDSWLYDAKQALKLTQEVLIMWLKLFVPVATYYSQQLLANPEIALALLALLLLWLMQRTIRRRRYVARAQARVQAVTGRVRNAYRAFKQRVESTSRIAGALLPHVLFFSIMISLLVLWPDSANYLSSPKLFVAVAVWLPLLATTWNVFGYHKQAADALPQERVTAMKSWLSYWVAFGCLYTLFQFPFVESIFSLVPHADVLKLLFVGWLWLPFDGPGLVIRKIGFKWDPDAQLQLQKHAGLVHLGVRLKFYKQSTADFITEMLKGGLIVLVVPVLLFMPSFLAVYSNLFVGIVYPALMSVSALNSTTSSSYQRWLVYTVVLVTYWAIHREFGNILHILPFSYRIELLFIVWLQLPYFRGAEKVFLRFSEWWEGTVAATPHPNRAQTRLPPVTPAPTKGVLKKAGGDNNNDSMGSENNDNNDNGDKRAKNKKNTNANEKASENADATVAGAAAAAAADAAAGDAATATAAASKTAQDAAAAAAAAAAGKGGAVPATPAFQIRSRGNFSDASPAGDTLQTPTVPATTDRRSRVAFSDEQADAESKKKDD